MDAKKISVLMPVYNSEIFLGAAVGSVLDQTYSDFELIVIDDGSTDRSLEIIQSLAARDDRIHIISRENRGIVASLNEGIDHSTGCYIARMDSDDICHPERFEKQIFRMQRDQLDICGSSFGIIDKNGALVGRRSVPTCELTIGLCLLNEVPFPHPSVMIRRDFLRDNKLRYGRGMKYAEDLELWVNCYFAGGVFGNISEDLINYRVLTDSLSRRNHKKIQDDKRRLNFKFSNAFLEKLISQLINLDQRTFSVFNQQEYRIIAEVCWRSFLRLRLLKLLVIAVRCGFRANGRFLLGRMKMLF